MDLGISKKPFCFTTKPGEILPMKNIGEHQHDECRVTKPREMPVNLPDDQRSFIEQTLAVSRAFLGLGEPTST